MEFSAAHKFRVEIGDQYSPVLAKYDEKVYLEVKTLKSISAYFFLEGISRIL